MIWRKIERAPEQHIGLPVLLWYEGAERSAHGLLFHETEDGVTFARSSEARGMEFTHYKLDTGPGADCVGLTKHQFIRHAMKIRKGFNLPPKHSHWLKEIYEQLFQARDAKK